MQATPTRTSQLPDTAAWLLAATLLLSLLGLGSLARPAFASTQSQVSAHPAAPNPARMMPASWRPTAP